MTEDRNSGGSTDPAAEDGRAELECIGSFRAFSQEGEAYTIEIWTHFGALHNRDRNRVSTTQLVLTTTDGGGVERVDQGEYRLTDNPEISLSTDDPNAP